MRTMRTVRGSALPETVIVIGLVCLLLFGALRLALAGYYQSMVDGSAFVGARAWAQNPGGGSTYATGVISAIFPRVASTNVTLSATGSTITSTATQTIGGLLIPGAPSTITLRSSSAEPIGVATPPSLATYPYTANATLANYRNAANIPNATHPLAIAQKFATGNGKNGRFAEWYCRQKVYSGVSFPATRPTTGGPGSQWDPASPSSPLYAIYQWDTGATCT